VNAVGRDVEDGVKVKVKVKVDDADRASRPASTSRSATAARGSGAVGGRRFATPSRRRASVRVERRRRSLARRRAVHTTARESARASEPCERAAVSGDAQNRANSSGGARGSRRTST